MRFQRTHQWLADFAALEEQRRFLQAMTGYRKIQLVIFDEWMRDPVSLQEARHLLDFIDDRLGRLSCLFIGQIPVAAWHTAFRTRRSLTPSWTVWFILPSALKSPVTPCANQDPSGRGETLLRSGNLEIFLLGG